MTISRTGENMDQSFKLQLVYHNVSQALFHYQPPKSLFRQFFLTSHPLHFNTADIVHICECATTFGVPLTIVTPKFFSSPPPKNRFSSPWGQYLLLGQNHFRKLAIDIPLTGNSTCRNKCYMNSMVSKAVEPDANWNR